PLSKIEDFAHQFVDAIDLKPNGFKSFVARLRRRLSQSSHLGSQADDIQRIFEVVNDGTGKAADDRQALGLEHFAQVLTVERAQPMTDFPQESQGQRGTLFNQSEDIRAR